MSPNSRTANSPGHPRPRGRDETANQAAVHLFVDTNFFLQCHPPERLDWTAWQRFDEVRLIVSKPVLREIDYRKNKGNDRAAKRARKTSARFRRMRSDGQEIVRDANPSVILSIEVHHECSPAFEDRLDYGERDDQLIGTALGFATDNPGSTVFLITHDTTPLLTADSVGLPCEVIPDDWLLPPEHTKAEKEVRSLEAELARLKRSEPSFLVHCADEQGRQIEELATTSLCFEPLTSKELESLMERLRSTFPMETSFGRRETIEQTGTLLGATLSALNRVFTPATDEEIAKYKDSLYPEWLEECEAALTDCYKTPRQSPNPRFTFWTENRGTRPAKDALIAVEVEGDFRITPPVKAQNSSEDARTEDPQASPEGHQCLPHPPEPPKGKWEYAEDTLRRFEDTISALTESRIADPFRSMGKLESLSTPVPFVPTGPPARDPNSFYYEPKMSRRPERVIRLVCAQWRHMDGAEGFGGEIHIRPDQTGVRGALLFRVQAENLSEPVLSRIPVRIDVDHVSSFDRASALVDQLCSGSEAGKPAGQVPREPGTDDDPHVPPKP